VKKEHTLDEQFETYLSRLHQQGRKNPVQAVLSMARLQEVVYVVCDSVL
jgi:hypothetical protein